MNPWPFVISAYGIALGATIVTTWVTVRATRRAEARVAERPERD